MSETVTKDTTSKGGYQRRLLERDRHIQKRKREDKIKSQKGQTQKIHKDQEQQQNKSNGGKKRKRKHVKVYT